MRIYLHFKFCGQVYENSPLNFFIIKDDLTWVNMVDHRLVVLYEKNMFPFSLCTYIYIQIDLYQDRSFNKSLKVSVQSLRFNISIAAVSPPHEIGQTKLGSLENTSLVNILLHLDCFTYSLTSSL